MKVEQLTGKHSKGMLAAACAVSVAGIALLLWGEAANTLWIFIDGAIISAVGIACYYVAGEYRLLIESRYRRLTDGIKFWLLLLSCSPWIVMYFFIAPVWDFVLVAAFSPAACAAYVWWYPRLRGKAGAVKEG